MDASKARMIPAAQSPRARHDVIMLNATGRRTGRIYLNRTPFHV